MLSLCLIASIRQPSYNKTNCVHTRQCADDSGDQKQMRVWTFLTSRLLLSTGGKTWAHHPMQRAWLSHIGSTIASHCSAKVSHNLLWNYKCCYQSIRNIKIGANVSSMIYLWKEILDRDISNLIIQAINTCNYCLLRAEKSLNCESN